MSSVRKSTCRPPAGFQAPEEAQQASDILASGAPLAPWPATTPGLRGTWLPGLPVSHRLWLGGSSSRERQLISGPRTVFHTKSLLSTLPASVNGTHGNGAFSTHRSCTSNGRDAACCAEQAIPLYRASLLRAQHGLLLTGCPVLGPGHTDVPSVETANWLPRPSLAIPVSLDRMTCS